MREIEIISAPKSVKVEVFSKSEGYDTVMYRTLEDYDVSFYLDGSVETVTVKGGMEYDEDSVPRIPFIYSFAKGISSGVPATTHDFIYENQAFPQDVCDSLFYHLMRYCGVDSVRAGIIYYAVHKMGSTYYDAH